MLYRIGQLVAPNAPTAAAYICEDISDGALHLVLGDGEDHQITARALRELAMREGMRIELRFGIGGLERRNRRALNGRAPRQRGNASTAVQANSARVAGEGASYGQ